MRTLRMIFTAVIFVVGLALAARPIIVSGMPHSDRASAPTTEPGPALLSPADGEALQGAVSITGRTAVVGFVSAELSFSYAANPTDTWFPIWQSAEPLEAGTLVVWDTSVMTDSVYNLRLVVNLQDGSQRVSMVRGLRVRNYSAVETSTPTPPAAVPAAVTAAAPTSTPTVTPVYPTATLLPTSAAALTQGTLAVSMMQGAAIALVLFASVGGYLAIRALLHR